MRRAAIAVLAAALAVAALAAVSARGPHQVLIRVNGQTLSVRGEVRFDQVYVDALPLARALDLRAVYFPDKPLRGVWLQDERGQKYVHLHVGQNDCHIGDQTVTLPYPALYLQSGTNAPMAPVRFVGETFGAQVEERPAPGNPRVIDITSRPAPLAP